MKNRIITTLAMLLTVLYTSAQTNPTLIDFEPGNYNPGGCNVPYAQNETDLLDNNYFLCAYNITFHMGSIKGGAPTVAQVGAPTVAWGSGTSFTYNNPNCSVPANISSDKPTNNKDVGCWFITDDANGPGLNPKPLYVDYHDLECTEASGYLMDVDGTNNVQEGWKITAYGIGGSQQTVYVLSPQFNLYQNPIPTPQVNPVGGDGEASYWYVNLGTDPIDYIEFIYIGHPSRSVGLAFDEFAICSAQEEPVPTRGCCETENNLIPNGSFESGNTGFSTGGYTYQGAIAPGSVQEGQYSIVNSSQANTISNCWDLVDHTTCEEDGHFMVVNGRTHNPFNAIVYEQSDIEVEEGKEYKFCMYYQHLPQCSFDVFNPDDLFVGIDGGDIIGEDDCEGDEEHCGWTKITYTLIATSSHMNIQILINEGGIGDGNDVAFDDISLVEKGPMPSNYCTFNIATTSTGTGTYNITATAVTNPLPSGYNVQWTVTEANCSTWAPIGGTTMSYSGWNPYNTNFPGYCCNPGSGTAGSFSTSKCYILSRVVSDCCHEDCEHRILISSQPGLLAQAKGGKQPEEDETVLMMSADGGENWVPLQVFSNNNIELYPNPGDGAVGIRSSSSLQGAKVTVYNVESKVVLKQSIEGTKSNVNISSLPNGVYSFEIVESNGAITHKRYIKK